jgi:uncharacterized protein YlxP (DUF503 family)
VADATGWRLDQEAAMVVGVLRLEVEIPEGDSLKAKRAVLNKLKTRVQNGFNVAIAEVADNEVWNYATLGVVTVSNQQQFVNQVLDKVVDLIESFHQVVVMDSTMEFTHYD